MDFRENKDWQSWREQHPHEPTKLLKKIWEASDTYKSSYRPDEEKGLVSLKSRMNQHKQAKIVRLSPFKLVLRIAAGFAILLGAALFIKGQFSDSENHAVLVSTTSETKELSLADGSTVTLNEASQVSYDDEFLKEERRVSLEGEAFFKIARDVNRPFVVETSVGLVSVLGTSFNVRTYPDDDLFEVFVETGKVKVEFKDAIEPVLLNSGEFLRFNKSRKKALKGKDKSGLPNAWRTGVINYKGQSIPDILLGMERLFNVNFDLKTEQSSDCLQTLTVQKGQMQEAIDVLKTSCPQLNFEKDENGGYVVSGSCCD